MKKIKTLMLLFVAALTTAPLSSCDNDDDNYYDYPYFNLATVTLRAPLEDGGRWFMQLNDSTALFANNITSHPYDNKELRAYIRYNNVSTEEPRTTKSYYVDVLSLDTILTKNMDKLLTKDVEAKEGKDPNAEEYGDDPVEIVNSWETVAEDGYLTLRFRTTFAGIKPHRVNLVHRNDLANPYVLEFFHDAMGEEGGQLTDGLAAFRLSDFFNMGDEPITITLKWSSFSGEKTKTFKYSPRKD